MPSSYIIFNAFEDFWHLVFLYVHLQMCRQDGGTFLECKPLVATTKILVHSLEASPLWATHNHHNI